MGRLKSCKHENKTTYTDCVDCLGLKSCVKCRLACSKSKVPCRQSFWEIHKVCCTNSSKRRVMVAKAYWLKETIKLRKELKREIEEWGHLPARKEIRECEDIDEDLYLDQMEIESQYYFFIGND